MVLHWLQSRPTQTFLVLLQQCKLFYEVQMEYQSEHTQELIIDNRTPPQNTASRRGKKDVLSNQCNTGWTSREQPARLTGSSSMKHSKFLQLAYESTSARHAHTLPTHWKWTLWEPASHLQTCFSKKDGITSHIYFYFQLLSTCNELCSSTTALLVHVQSKHRWRAK